MSHERSDKLHFAWQEAAQRFDYFLAGVSAALVAYVGQSLTVQAFGWNGPTIEVGAVVCFCGAFYAGAKRIEAMNYSQLTSIEQHYHIESASSKEKAAGESDFLKDLVSGQVYLPDGLIDEAKEHRAIAAKSATKGQEAQKWGLRFYKWRNWLLLAGFSLLAAARVLAAVQATAPNP